jgi:hypothetical protein
MIILPIARIDVELDLTSPLGELKLIVWENRVVWEIFGLKSQKVTTEWRTTC